jgi:hypothetical protein
LHGLAGQPSQVGVLVVDVTCGGGLQVEQYSCRGRLAAARLADQPERFMPVQVERHVAHRVHLADRAARQAVAAHRKVLDKVAHRQHRLRGGRH